MSSSKRFGLFSSFVEWIRGGRITSDLGKISTLLGHSHSLEMAAKKQEKKYRKYWNAYMKWDGIMKERSEMYARQYPKGKTKN